MQTQLESPQLEQQLTEQEVADLTSLSIYWFRQKRYKGGGPPFRKIGRSVRYPAASFVEWLASHGLITVSTGEVA